MTQFKKGRSGNPAGRPRGLPDSRHLAKYLSVERIQKIINKLAEQAENGDIQAANTLLNKALSGFKPETPLINGLALDHSKSLLEQCQQITESMANGDISPDQGRILIDALQAQARIFEVSELEQRLTALESRQ